MKKLIPLLLLLCAVVTITAPASAGDYWFYKDVNATALTNAVIDDFNANGARNVPSIELAGHRVIMYNVNRPTIDSIEFRIACSDRYFFFLPPITFLPIASIYSFRGIITVDDPKRGMERPFDLQIMPNDQTYTARGENWYMTVVNMEGARFKV